MDAFEGLWFDCEDGDEGTTAKEQVSQITSVTQQPHQRIRGDFIR